MGVRKRREIRPNCPSCKSDKVTKNGSSRGKYKCNVCRRTFYDANSRRMSREQKERILKEYLNRMSMSIIAKVEGKPLTTV